MPPPTTLPWTCRITNFFKVLNTFNKFANPIKNSLASSKVFKVFNSVKDAPPLKAFKPELFKIITFTSLLESNDVRFWLSSFNISDVNEFPDAFPNSNIPQLPFI